MKRQIPRPPHATRAAGREGAPVRQVEQIFGDAVRCAQGGDAEGAARGFAEFVKLRPNMYQGHFNLARALGRLSRLAPAIEHLRRTIELKPDHLPAIAMLANVLLARDDVAGAITSYEQALKLAPDDPHLLGNFAMALAAANRGSEAGVWFQRALKTAPDSAQLHYNYGNFLSDTQNVAASVVHLQRAVELDPGYAKAWTGLGIALMSKQPLRAGECFEQALRHDPGHVTAVTGLLSLHRRYCNFDGREAAHGKLLALLQAPTLRDVDWKLAKGLIYSHLFMPLPLPGVYRLREHLAQAVQREAVLAGPPLPLASPEASPRNTRLRIGYLSPNFGDHPVGQVTLSLFGAHDRQRFEVHGFLTRRAGSDGSATAGLHRERFEHFHEIGHLGAPEAAACISSQGIDMLIDLDGFMDHSSLPILARRPAPVQIFWLGHAGRLGMPFVDYVIADEQVLPRGKPDGLGEAVIRLPGTYHCADRHSIATDCPPRAAWNLPEHGTVYCVFNNPEKIDRTIMDCWLRILAAVDGSVLWFSTFRQSRELLMAMLHKHAALRGIAPERLIVADRVPGKALHLARLAHADLMLDTVTLNASTTALDALWAGVPLLAVSGDRFSNRISTSMLHAIGMPDMVCADLAEYEHRAIELGRQAATRQLLRQRLAHNRDTMPLFNIGPFARRLEAALEAVWHRRGQGLPPADIDAPDPVAGTRPTES